MAYQPQFTVTPGLLGRIERVSALRERILASAVQVPWIPALQRDARQRNTHSSTAIEGNPLTLEEVRILEEGKVLPSAPERARREILNELAALRHIEKLPREAPVSHEHVLKLHALIGSGVMDQGAAGHYRAIRVRVGSHLPPAPEKVQGLMTELLEWWNVESGVWSPVVSSAVLHYRFESIHPFADGNGRTGRALAVWDLYRRGFDTHHIFSVDEFYWEDRPRYYRMLDETRLKGEDLTGWLEYCAEGLHGTLERVWERIGRLVFSVKAGDSILLTPRQERLMALLRERGGLAPREIWKDLRISKQGALDLIRPLAKAGLLKRIGTRKSGRYVLP